MKLPVAAALALGGSFANAQSGAPGGAGSATGDSGGKFCKPLFDQGSAR
jgi:hypothetical protein